MLDELLRLEEYDSEELDIIYGIREIEECENYTEDECLEVWGDIQRLMRKIDSE